MSPPGRRQTLQDRMEVKWQHNSRMSERELCVQPEEVFNWFLIIRNSPHSCKQEAVTVGPKRLDRSLNHVQTFRQHGEQSKHRER